MTRNRSESNWRWRAKVSWLTLMRSVHFSGVLFFAVLGAGMAARGENYSAAAALGARLFDDPRLANPAAKSASPVSCRACHPTAIPGDPPARNPVPARTDGRLTTPRNAQALEDALTPLRDGWGLLHWDGEFARPEDLVRETFLGRNFGWLPSEHREALRNFANAIRADGPRGSAPATASEWSYATLLRGDDPRIPDAWRLPPELRLDPAKASDSEILDACARLVTAYLQTQQFARDAEGLHRGSAYDAFLEANRLPRAPRPNETPHEYARRLHIALGDLKNPKFVEGAGSGAARFGELEFRGLQIFFRGTLGYTRATGSGNCAECHVPPAFTDDAFHNTGAAQDAYDAAHGAGKFAKLPVPSLKERNADFNRWLPPTAAHPAAAAPFRPSVDGKTVSADLGLWNIYANPDLPAPQSAIERKLNPEGRLSADQVLALTLGRFKTPTLRGLARSAPYLHDGSQRSIEDVIRFYLRANDLAQEKRLRNAPNEFAAMKLADDDVAPLAAFLRSLDDAPPGS